MRYTCTAMDEVQGESIRVPGVLSVVVEAVNEREAVNAAVRSFRNVGHDFIEVKPLA